MYILRAIFNANFKWPSRFKHCSCKHRLISRIRVVSRSSLARIVVCRRFGYVARFSD